MALPTTKVEIAFSTQPDDPSPVWEDVTMYVRALTAIVINRGRQDQFETVQPARLSGLTLINRDGRFTPGNSSSVYYPNVKKGRKIRVSETWAGVTYRRFTGFIDEWPVTWADASATVADVQITATSRTGRLGRGKTLPSIVELEYLLDGPLAYYPLGEDTGSSRAGNVAPTTPGQMEVTVVGGGSAGNIIFGSAVGPTTDSLTAAAFTRIGPTAGANLVLTSQTELRDGTVASSILLEAFFQSSSTQEMGIVQADQIGFFTGQTAYYIGTSATGKLIGVNWLVGVPAYTITSAATVTDGNIHHVALRETYNGVNTVADLFLDGVNVGTSSLVGDWTTTIHRLVGGGGVINSCFVGTLAHVSLTATLTPVSDARILQHAQAGLTGFSGERSDQRIQRLAVYAGVPTSDVVVETGLSTSVAAQDTGGQQPIALMQDVAATEGGVLFDAGDGRLTFHARSHRYNSATALTLRAAGGGTTGELQANLEPRLDDQDLVNDMTASRTGGVSVRVVDAASVAEYGTYHEETVLLTTSDNEVADAASWKVYIGSTPLVKVPVAEADLTVAASAQKTALLAREIGDRITLSNLPAQAPASTMDFFIEGWTETITAETHRIAFNLSPAALSGVWQLDSSVYSVLGSTTRLAY